MTLIDTADQYGMGHKEVLIGEAIRHRPRYSSLLSAKFGSLRNVWIRADSFDRQPKAVKTFVASSKTRLGVDHSDIYRPARLNPDVPIFEGPILEACRRHDIGITAFGVLARGLISGHWQKISVANVAEAREQGSRLLDTMLERNLTLVEAMRHTAQADRITVAQIAIAWVAAQGKEIVPLIGARRKERLDEAVGAADDLASIEQFLNPV